MAFQPKTFDNDIEVQGRISATVTLALGYPTIVGANKTIEAIGAGSDIRIDLIPKGASSVRLPSAYITRITDNEDVINKEYADKRIASKQLGANLLAPSPTENGFAIVWDDTSSTFILAPSAGSNTFGSGLENVAGAVKLGGTPLDRHTEIVGAFDLRLGTAANKLVNILGDVTTKVEFLTPTSRLTLNGTNPLELVGGAASSSIIFNAGGAITINDNLAGINRRGLRAGADYSANVQSTDYVQKIYVDNRLAGMPVSPLLMSPGPANHNWSVVWDSSISAYTLFDSVPTATAKKQQRFTADGIQTSFTVTNGTLDQLDFVEVNGNVQQVSIHFTVALQVVSFGTALPAGAQVTIHYFDGLIVGTGGDITLGAPMEIPFVDGTGTDLEYNTGLKFDVGTQKLIASKINVATPPATDPTLTGLLVYDSATGDVKQRSLASIDHFKGVFDTVASLTAAHPTALPGDYAYVDAGAGATPELYIWDDSDAVWALGGSGGGEFGIIGRGYWKFSTSTATGPTSGQVRFDNATMSSVTKIYLNEVSDEGANVANFLVSVSIGDKFYIQQKSDSARWMEAVISGTPIDNGTWWELPVVVEDTSDILPQNNQVTLIRLAGSAGTETLFLTHYATGNSVTTVFAIPGTEPIKIVAAYVGGQRMQEGVQYSKNDTARTVTFATAPPTGTSIDIEYLQGLLTTSGINIWDEGTYGLAVIATQIETNLGIDDTKGITAQKLGNKPEHYDGGSHTTVVNLTVNNRKFKRTIIGALAYTKAGTYSADHEGNVRKDFLVANGVNKPTFSSDFVIAWDNWVNTINTLNVVRFEYLSNGKIAVDMRNY